MKKIVYKSIAFCILFFIQNNANFRTPQMPRDMDSYIKNKKTKKPSLKKRASKSKRKGLQGYTHRHTFSEMDFNELITAKEDALKAKNYDQACKYLEKAINIGDDINQKALLMLDLSDILFNQEKFDDAYKWYTEFTQLYPGNEKIEYASYKSILCTDKKILNIDRDQTYTEKTLELANDFLNKYTNISNYTDEIKKIQKRCYQLLAQNECYITEFYIKNKSYASAERRLKAIRNNFLEKTPEVQVSLAHLENTLASEYTLFKTNTEPLQIAENTKSSDKKIDMTTRF